MENDFFPFISTAEYAGLVSNIFVCVKGIIVWTDAVYMQTSKKHVDDPNLQIEIMCQLLYDVSAFDMSIPLHAVIHFVSSWSGFIHLVTRAIETSVL